MPMTKHGWDVEEAEEGPEEGGMEKEMEEEEEGLEEELELSHWTDPQLTWQPRSL